MMICLNASKTSGQADIVKLFLYYYMVITAEL